MEQEIGGDPAKADSADPLATNKTDAEAMSTGAGSSDPLATGAGSASGRQSPEEMAAEGKKTQKNLNEETEGKVLKSKKLEMEAKETVAEASNFKKLAKEKLQQAEEAEEQEKHEKGEEVKPTKQAKTGGDPTGELNSRALFECHDHQHAYVYVC